MEKNKQTAIQKLAEIVDSMIAKSLMAPQDKETTVGYQVAAVEIKKYIGGLLLMEQKQIEDAYDSGCTGEVFELNCNESAEQYYKSRYGKE